MTQMTDPMDGLTKLQLAMDNKWVELEDCESFDDVKVIFDRPNGEYRFSYAKVIDNSVQAFAVFVIVEPIEGVTCINLGYAVPEHNRGKGLGTEILTKSIEELKNGLGKNGISEFYLEAIISRSNIASQKIASKIISSTPEECTDSFSGQPAYSYTKLMTA